MPGGQKKATKQSKKRKDPAVSSQGTQKPSRYVIPPTSPVKTRSAELRAAAPEEPASVRDVNVEVLPPASVVSSVLSSQTVQEMESGWDARFSKMETAIRTGLTNSATASEPVHPVQPVQVAAAAPPQAPQAETQPPTKKKSSRHRHRSTSPSSLEDSSESASSSECESEQESESEEESSTDKKKKRKSSKGKYDSAKYLHGKDTVDSYERLVLANTRMALSLLKKWRNIKGLLRHMILIADKADKDVFTSAALCDYDSAIKRTAGEKGLRSIGKTDPVAIVEHLSYDSTQAAANAKRNEKRRKSGKGASGTCYKFNTQEGCKGNCGYRHVCSSCGSHNHIALDCPRRPGAVHSNRK